MLFPNNEQSLYVQPEIVYANKSRLQAMDDLFGNIRAMLSS